MNKDYLKNDIKAYGVGFAIGLLFVALMDIIFHKVCPVRLFFGIPCPACGLTRAFVFAIHGEFAKAFFVQPFFYALILFIILSIIFRYFVTDKDRSKMLMRLVRNCVIITLLCAVIFYIYRMINYFPDTYPMKYDPDNITAEIIRIFRR